MKVKNVRIKDIYNMQTLFFKKEDGKEMYFLIRDMEKLGYIVRIQVNENEEIDGLFFINEKAIEDARRWPEAITVDATYKTNAYKLSLVNIVGTSNVMSDKVDGSLQTFAVAAAFISSEKEEKYQWIMEELREAVWPKEKNFRLPSVFVTDNEKALRNAIECVFPESQHLLCSWHLWNTMKQKLKCGTVADDVFKVRRTEAEIDFQSIVSSYNEQTYDKAVSSFKKRITVPGTFANNGADAVKHLDNV